MHQHILISLFGRRNFIKARGAGWRVLFFERPVFHTVHNRRLVGIKRARLTDGRRPPKVMKGLFIPLSRKTMTSKSTMVSVSNWKLTYQCLYLLTYVSFPYIYPDQQRETGNLAGTFRRSKTGKLSENHQQHDTRSFQDKALSA
jgi:hypothetical protein